MIFNGVDQPVVEHAPDGKTTIVPIEEWRDALYSRCDEDGVVEEAAYDLLAWDWEVTSTAARNTPSDPSVPND